MLGTVTYFIIAQKKTVELKVVSTAIELETPSVNRRMSETPSVNRRMSWQLRRPSVNLLKLTDTFSEGDTRANSIAYLIAFTMGFEALLR